MVLHLLTIENIRFRAKKEKKILSLFYGNGIKETTKTKPGFSLKRGARSCFSGVNILFMGSSSIYTLRDRLRVSEEQRLIYS